MSSSSMHVAKTGLNAQQTRMQIIANNLSNVNTSGLKGIEQILNPYFIKLRELAASKLLSIQISHLHLQLVLVLE